MNILSFISAPAITSITFTYHGWDLLRLAPFDMWADVDEWLVQIVKHAKVGGGFPLAQAGCSSDETVWEGFLCKLREAGG